MLVVAEVTGIALTQAQEEMPVLSAEDPMEALLGREARLDRAVEEMVSHMRGPVVVVAAVPTV